MQLWVFCALKYIQKKNKKNLPQNIKYEKH